MNLPDAPIPDEGFFPTHFFAVSDQERSKDSYVRILGGKVLCRDTTHPSPKVGTRRPSTLRIAQCEPEAKDLPLAGAGAALPRHRFRECGRKIGRAHV